MYGLGDDTGDIIMRQGAPPEVRWVGHGYVNVDPTATPAGGIVNVMAIDPCAPIMDPNGRWQYPSCAHFSVDPSGIPVQVPTSALPPNALITGPAQAASTGTNPIAAATVPPPAVTATGLFGMSTTTLLIAAVAAFFLLGGHKH